MPGKTKRARSSCSTPKAKVRMRRPSGGGASVEVAPKPVKPKTCTCRAYRWPHRPGGGLCRWPDPPLKTCNTPPGTNRPTMTRRRGERALIMRAYGLHPIRDRKLIDHVMRQLYLRPGIRLEDAATRAAQEAVDPQY